MKNLLIVTTLLLIFSCKEKKESTIIAENSNIISNVESKSSNRYSKGSSLIDAIYFEMIKEDKVLSAMDDEIIFIRENSHKIIKEKEEFLYKPTEYYAEVNQKIKLVKDSVLKIEMQNFIKESLDKFTKNKNDLQLVIKQIESNNKMINQHYDYFKIKKTLPEIEKYQNQNPLKLEEFKKMIDDQNQLLEKLKKMK